MQRIPNPWRLATLLTCTLILTGCQSYQPEPLDLQQRARDWAERSLDDPAIADTAARLRNEPADAAAGGYDPADGLTLREAEPVALVFNAELRARRLRARVPLAGAEFAGLWDDPELDGDLLSFVNNMDDPWIAGVGISFTVPLSGRLRVEADQAWAEVEHAWLTAAQAEWALLEELRLKWVGWSANRLKREAIDAYLTELAPLLDSVERLAEAGEVDPASARLLRIDAAQRSLERSRLEAQERLARLELLALLGLTPDAEVQLIPDMVERDGRGIVVGGGDSAELLAAHPDLRLAQADYERAELALRREVVKQYPDVTIGPRFEDEEGQSRLGVGFGLPLPLWNRNQRGIAEARAQRDAAAAEAEAVMQCLRAELAVARARHSAAEMNATSTADTLGPLVVVQLEELRALAELGEVDVLLLREALASVAEARLAVIDAQQARAKAAIEIESITNPRWAVPHPPRPAE